MRAAIILLAATSLAGCVGGGMAEFEPMAGTGSLTPSRLTMAQGKCYMATMDSRAGAAGVPAIVEYARACYAAEGIHVKGFRHSNGMLTAYPLGGGVIEPAKKR